MSAHTPGPWVLSGWTAPDDYGWSIKVGDAPYRIEVSAWSASSEADARLIAAAPDLLAELRETLEALEVRYDGAPDSSTRWMGHRIARLEAAIAKAEGKP